MCFPHSPGPPCSFGLIPPRSSSCDFSFAVKESLVPGERCQGGQESRAGFVLWPRGLAPQCGPALPSSDLSLRSQPRALTCSPRPDSPGRCSGCRATNGDGQRALEIEWSVTWRGEEDFCARWSGAAVVGPDSLCSAASPDWLHQGGSAGVQSREAAVSSGWGAGCARRSLNGSMCRGNSAQGRWAVTSRFIHSSCGCLLSTDLGEASRRVHLWRRQ